MNADFGELLREGIGRLEVPRGTGAGLTVRARRRHRIRRAALRASATAGTAAAAGVAVALAVTLGAAGSTPNAGHPAVRTVAYVARHIQVALARANLIQRVTMTGQGTLHAIEPTVSTPQHLLTYHPRCTKWGRPQGPKRNQTVRCLATEPGRPELLVVPDNLLSQSVRVVGWSYRGRLREEGFTVAGRLVFDASSMTGPSGLMRFQSADYVDRTWWRGGVRQQLQPALEGNSGPASEVQLDGSTSASWPNRIRQMLTSPAYRIVGRQEIDGISAIKIKGVWPWHGWPAEVTQQQEILWVDPSSYLPLRDEQIWIGHHGPICSLVATYHWLTPTPARLAALHTPVPHRFHRATHGPMLIPGSVFILGGIP